MNKSKKFFAIVMLALVSVSPAFAGGILTNTNQNVSFLRNPARDAAIGIDGVYSNPAGVAFLKEGLHLSVNWQAAFQTRTIDTTDPTFAFGAKNYGNTTKTFEGKAKALFIPSVQAAYNMNNKWSFQFNFSVTGGGGKCEFSNGLGSFEGAVGKIAYALKDLGVTNYDCNSYMQGKQYYFGFTLGTAYKITDNFSVYGGVRMLYGNADYKAKIENIMVKTAANDSYVTFGDFLDQQTADLNVTKALLEAAMAAYGPATPASVKENYVKVATTLGALDQLGVYRDGVNLQSSQSGFGIAPILGADLKLDKFNFAVKYEFRTKMSMENESTVKQAYAIDAVNVFRDGTSIREDQPSLLAFGVQYEINPAMRANVGYHHFYDKAAKKTYYLNGVRYDNKNSYLSRGTDEYLAGFEWDFSKKWTASAGLQVTKYGNTDEYINDISFVVNSWSFGLGAKYQVSEKLALQAAYFQTNYGDYKTTMSSTGVQNNFTRTNYVVAIGADYDF